MGTLIQEPEIRRKAAGKRHFVVMQFSKLQCSFPLAAQLLEKMTFALQKSKCCSATSAAQLSALCSATSVFACGMLQGWCSRRAENHDLNHHHFQWCFSMVHFRPIHNFESQMLQKRARLILIRNEREPCCLLSWSKPRKRLSPNRSLVRPKR